MLEKGLGVAEELKRKGRPPKGALAGTRVSLGLKVSASTKALIDERARASGRTQSQEAEAWLDQARALNVLGSSGPGVSDALQAMARAALDVKLTVGDPTVFVAARDELRQRWGDIARSALPHVTEPAAMAAAMAAIRVMRLSALGAGDALYEAGLHETDGAEAWRALAAVGNAKLFPGVQGWSEALILLESAGKRFGGDVQAALEIAVSSMKLAEASAARAVSTVENQP